MLGSDQRASELEHTRYFWHLTIAQVMVAIVAVSFLLVQLFAKQLGLPVWNLSENWQYPVLIVVVYFATEVLGTCLNVVKEYFGLGREIRAGLENDLEILEEMRNNLSAPGDR